MSRESYPGHRPRRPQIENRIRNTVEHRMHANSVSVLETIENRHHRTAPRSQPQVEAFAEKVEQAVPVERTHWLRHYFLVKAVVVAALILVVGIGFALSGPGGKQQLHVVTTNNVASHTATNDTNSSNTANANANAPSTSAKTPSTATSTPSTTNTSTTKTTVTTTKKVTNVSNPTPSPSPSPDPSPSPPPTGSNTTGASNTTGTPTPTPVPSPLPPSGGGSSNTTGTGGSSTVPLPTP